MNYFYTLQQVALLLIIFTYFNRFVKDDGTYESNSSYSSDTSSDESTSVTADNIADENIKEAVDKPDWNKRKLVLYFGSNNRKPLKRFLYVILVYTFLNIFMVNNRCL